jgi:MFS family permease
MLSGSLVKLFLPLAARSGTVALFVCLFLIGTAHGAILPSVSSFWAYWAPPAERARTVGFASTGSRIGNILALSIGGYLCAYGFDGGWPSIFYTFGGSGIVWSALFFVLTSNLPSTHWFISKREADYILETTKKSIDTRAALKSVC